MSRMIRVTLQSRLVAGVMSREVGPVQFRNCSFISFLSAMSFATARTRSGLLRGEIWLKNSRNLFTNQEHGRTAVTDMQRIEGICVRGVCVAVFSLKERSFITR